MAAGGPQMLATSNVLWCGVTCHPADAGDDQCLKCGCSSPSCTVVLCAADIDGPHCATVCFLLVPEINIFVFVFVFFGMDYFYILCWW